MTNSEREENGVKTPEKQEVYLLVGNSIVTLQAQQLRFVLQMCFKSCNLEYMGISDELFSLNCHVTLMN